jgi:hypothetical protein
MIRQDIFIRHEQIHLGSHLRLYRSEKWVGGDVGGFGMKLEEAILYQYNSKGGGRWMTGVGRVDRSWE